MYSKQENIRLIKRSLDMKVYKRILIAYGIGVGLGVVYGLGTFRDYEPVYFWMFLGLSALIIVPLMGIWVWRMWKLFRAPEEYFFTRATLESPHQCWWPRGMRFRVVIEHPKEGTLAVNTNPIFRPVGWEQPLLEDYLNKTVTVGCNRETGMVVVID